MGSVGLMNNSTLICAPLMGESVEEMISDMHKAKSECADLVEIRLDTIKNFKPKQDIEILLKNKPLPIITAYRPISEGGQFECDNSKQLEVLLLAKELGADYTEIDFKEASSFNRENKLNVNRKSKIIVSCYVDSLASSNVDLTDLVAQMQLAGADIVKIVLNATDITETAKLFDLLSHCQVPLIACATGDRGLISHLLGPKFGGFLVYGSIKDNAVVGLPTLNNLKEVYKVDCLAADTKVFGLISKPVSHSKGPILHNPSFRHVEYNGIYVPMFVDNLKEFFAVYSDADFPGFSVGIPYKEAALKYCDEVHPLAQRIGAVNTIIRRRVDGKLVGYNTDCEASITAIEDALRVQGCMDGEARLSSPLSGKLFVLVGAGGAGRPLAIGAKSRGTRVVVFDIDFDRAKSLADAVDGKAYPFEHLHNFKPEKGSILANATPLGMHPNKDRIPVDAETLKDYKVVFDAVYTPRKTTLQKEAEAAGAIAVSGVEMFLRQAIGQFNLFTGNQAPEEFMRQIVLAKF